ncbi:MAG: lysylphosphatidylglycerol synthase domain-containing protein, partial [Pseudomonadota bacterium]
MGALWKGLDFSLVVKLAVSLAAIWLVFKLGWGWNDLPEIRLAAPVWLLAAIGANFAILVLLSLRLRLVMSLVPDVQQPGLGWCIAVNWMGLGAAQIALGMISNDALRLAALTRRRYGLGAAASVIVADRAIGLLGLLLIGLGAMSVVIPGFWIALPILLMSLVFGLWCLAKLAVKGGRIGRALDLIAIIASNPRMLLAVPLAVLTHAQSVVVFYSVGRAVDIVPPVPETIVAVPAGLLA